MSRMTDTQFAEAKRMARELHRFLDKHGDDGDDFTEVWAALESLVGPKGALSKDTAS